MKQRGQQGYVLFTVVVMLVVVAIAALLVSYDSSLKASMPAGEAEASRADYLTEAAMQHALWRSANNACMGSVTIPTTALGSDSYTAAITGAAAGTFHTLTADQDAWIRSDQPTNNNGGDSNLHIKDSQIEQPLYRFDLSSLPAGAQINFATASFYVSGEHPEGPVTVHRITTGWTEADATWDSISGSVDSGVLATISAQPAGGVRVQVNITAQVQAWVNGQPNNGILLASSAPGIHAQYVSREGAPNQQPRLDVVVGSGPASPVNIQATGTLANGNTRSLTRVANLAYQPPNVVTLQLGTDPGADANLDDFYPRNYGGSNFVELSEDTGNWLQRPILRFGLGGIPAQAAVLSAQLELRMRSLITPGAATVHRVTRSWVEGTKNGTGTADGATWATYDGTNNWTTAGGDFNAAAVAETAINGGETWVSWEIGPLVEQWLAGEANDGLLIKGDAALREAEFYTKEEADATLRPKLTITYACECGSPCMGPQGSGNVLMVVDSTTSPWGEDIYKRDLLESWGYTVTMLADGHGQSTFDSAIAANDVILVSETIASTDLGTKLGNPAIGIVNTDGWMNDELGIESANSSNWPVGNSITITDTSHDITAPLASGSLPIYDADMGGLAIGNTPAPGLQSLANWGTDTGLAVLETGALMANGGSAAGRRVMLPFGRDILMDWSRLNNSGHLILQRALAWGMNANAVSGGNLLLVVGDATNLTTEDAAKKAVIESWGYAVVPISDEEPQATVDAALASADVVYIAESVTSGNVSTKYTGTTIGVLNEEGDLDDELGFSSTNITYWATDVSIVDNSHYITETFASGPLTIVDSSQRMNALAGTMAGGIQNLAISGSNSALDILESGATLWGGGSATGRRVKLPWATGTDFDINALNANGRTMLKRAIEWGAGAGAGSGCGSTTSLLMIVADAANPTAEELSRETLLETWCYSVMFMTASEPQEVYDKYALNNDVVYVPASVNYADVTSKLKLQPVGVVSEVATLSAHLGFTSGTSGYTGTATELTDNTHYITSGLTLGSLPITTTSTSLRTFVNTMGPGFKTHATRPSFTYPMIMTLETGDELLWGGNAEDRRVMLPWGGSSTFDVNNLTADGQTILQRSLEWAAAGDEPLDYKLLLVAADPSSLTSAESDRKALMESWGLTVTLIDDNDSQANFDTAAAANDVAYIAQEVNHSAIGSKLRQAPIGVVNEKVALFDDLGFASLGGTITTLDGTNVTDNTHYITSGFDLGDLTIVSPGQQLHNLMGTLSPDLIVLSDRYGVTLPALAVLESGADLYGVGNAPARRVWLPWGGNIDGTFPITSLNADGKTIMKRSIEWAAGAGGGGGGGGGTPLLFVVPDPASLSSRDSGWKTQFEAWGYFVTVIDDNESQANFDAAVAANQAVYVSTSISSSALSTKLDNSAVAIVNESSWMIDNFGFSNYTTSTFSDDTFTRSEAAHYISSPFGGGEINVLTTWRPMRILPIGLGTLAPGLQSAAGFTNSHAVATLDTGAERWDGDPSPGRRVHLPFAPAVTTQVTADGLTLVRRAIEWAAGPGGGGGPDANFGFDTIFGSSQDNVRRKQIATQVTLSEDGTATSITAYVGGRNNRNVRYAIYSDVAGEPGTLLAETANAQTTTAMDWLAIDLPDTALTAGTYWLALSFHDSNQKYHYESGGQTRYNNNRATDNGYTATWGSSTASYTRNISIYGTYTPN